MLVLAKIGITYNQQWLAQEAAYTCTLISFLMFWRSFLFLFQHNHVDNLDVFCNISAVLNANSYTVRNKPLLPLPFPVHQWKHSRQTSWFAADLEQIFAIILIHDAPRDRSLCGHNFDILCKFEWSLDSGKLFLSRTDNKKVWWLKVQSMYKWRIRKWTFVLKCKKEGLQGTFTIIPVIPECIVWSGSRTKQKLPLYKAIE